MATIKIKFRASCIEDHEGSIYYQIIHERVPRQITTTYHIFPSEWDYNRGHIIIPKDSNRKSYLTLVRERIKTDRERLLRIIRTFDEKGLKYSSDDVFDEFRNYSSRLSIVSYMENEILQLKQNNKTATAEHYRSALSSFRHFLSSRNETDITLDNITSDITIAYEAYLQQNNVGRNASSAYMRTIRATYNRAVENGLIEQRNPFRRVFTGVDKTVKRSISLKTISKIKTLNLLGESRLDFARDMFLLSFYLRGMSFIDMAFLKKTDLKDGYLTYSRRKTGQRLVIKWTPDMQEIIDKYPINTTEYLFPIIRRHGLKEYYVYRNALARVNKALKVIGEKVGIPIKLTHYVARHSWASGAQATGISLKIISEGMGHENELTTQIYLASLDTSAIDRANDKIIRAIK